MTWGLVASAGASLVGGIMSSNAAGDAADAQAQASKEDLALRREMFDRQTELQEPFRQGGLAGMDRLMYLMGLSPRGQSGGQTGGVQSGGGSGAPMDANTIRARLLPQYSKPGAMESSFDGSEVEQYRQGAGTVDEAGLQAAIDAQTQQGTQGTGQATGMLPDGSADPEYGSLMRDFNADDLLANRDPGYQFRMDEGTQALERGAAARGGLNSGRAMKDLLRFGQGLGAQEYGSAFNRNQINKGFKSNLLQGLMGGGQTATNQQGVAAGNFAQGGGDAITQGGNARASGYVGQANAWNNAIGQGYGMYQDNQIYNLLNKPKSGGFGTGSNFGNQDYGQFL